MSARIFLGVLNVIVGTLCGATMLYCFWHGHPLLGILNALALAGNVYMAIVNLVRE